MRVCLLVSLFAVILLNTHALEKSRRKRYDGYKLLEVTPHTRAHLEYLNYVQTNEKKVDFWTEPRREGRAVHLMVPPHMVENIQSKLDKKGIQHGVHKHNVQEDLDKLWNSMDKKDMSGRRYDPEYWNEYGDIINEMDAMVGRCSSEMECSTYVIGQSVEGRDLKVMKVASANGTHEKAIWFDSLIHAREWLAGSTVMHIADRLTRNYSSDAVVRRFVNDYDFYFLPVMNPDGYLFTWTDDRFWRKSRNINEGSIFDCIGTDLNRNYEYFWGTGGSSGSDCADDYRGSAAASEPETQAVQAEAQRIIATGVDLVSWVSVHTAAEMWLIPYGFVNASTGNCQRPADHNDLMRVSNATCRAIEATYDTLWECGNGCEILYSTSGTTLDHMKSIGVKYAFTPELRGPFFDPPLDAIPKSYNEVWNGVVAMIDEIEAIEFA